MLARVPGRAGAPRARGGRVRPSAARGRSDQGARHRRDARLGRGAAVARRARADARGRRRDARRRPQVRGGHPPGPRRAGRAGCSPRSPRAAERMERRRPIPPSCQAPWGPEVDGRRSARTRRSVRAGAARRRPAARPRRGGRLRARPDPRRHRRPRSRSAPPARRSSSGAGTTASPTTPSSSGAGGARPAAGRLPGAGRSGDRTGPRPDERPTSGRGRSRRPATSARRTGPDERGVPIPSEATTTTSDDDDRGRRRRARRVLARRAAAAPRVRPDDARPSCATPSGSSTRSMPAPRAAPDAPLRAALATAAAWRRGRCSGATSAPAASSMTWVWRRPIKRAALAGRAVRHLRLDGAPLAAAAAVRPGAVGARARCAPSRSCSGRA